jgi:hypothetical protein
MEQLSKISSNNQRLLNDFKARHPNNGEDLPLTPENIARLQWHLKQELRKGDFAEIEYKENVTARQMADSRRFETWEQMPAYMRCNYLRIADCFPGTQCLAIGGRVTGEYVERWSNEDIRRMRNELGKSCKDESDYDFLIKQGFLKIEINSSVKDNEAVVNEMIAVFKSGSGALLATSPHTETEKPITVFKESEGFLEVKKLPFNADYIHHKNPNDHKILIPMWDFSKLPDDKKQEARELFAAQKWGLLMKMHNNYGLSENQYCCDEQPIIKWFKWAIDNGKI